MGFFRVWYVVLAASSLDSSKAQDALEQEGTVDPFEGLRKTNKMTASESMSRFQSLFDSDAGMPPDGITEDPSALNDGWRMLGKGGKGGKGITTTTAPPESSRRRQITTTAPPESSRRRSKGRRRSGKGGKGSSRRRKSDESSKEQIQRDEFSLFAGIRWRHLHAKGHWCVTYIGVYPPRCYSRTGQKPCIAGLSDYCPQSAPTCRHKALNSIAFDCRLWRAAKTWLSEANKGKSEIEKLKAAGIYNELKKVDAKHPDHPSWSVSDDPGLMDVIHKWGFRAVTCCGRCLHGRGPFHHIVYSFEGNTKMCDAVGNGFDNVTKLAAVAYANNCAIMLLSFDGWLPNPKPNMGGHWLGKLPIETIDQSCVPDKYKDDPQLPPLCSGRKEDMFKCKRPPGPTPAPWGPGG